jgi:hypothetical protein
MKYVLTAAALMMAGATVAWAQEVQVEKKTDERPGINVQVPVPGAPKVEERKKIETTGQGNCDTKTVEKDTRAGEDKKTVKRCD